MPTCRICWWQGCKSCRNEPSWSAGTPGFTLPTDLCHYFNQNDGQLPDSLRATVSAALKKWVRRWVSPLVTWMPRCLCRCARLARLNARYDGHSVNIGLNDKTVPRWPPMPEMPVLHGTAIAALFRCMAMWLWACRKIFSRKYWTITSWSKPDG